MNWFFHNEAFSRYAPKFQIPEESLGFFLNLSKKANLSAYKVEVQGRYQDWEGFVNLEKGNVLVGIQFRSLPDSVQAFYEIARYTKCLYKMSQRE